MNKKRLVFQAPILTQSGYGARARDLAKCLLDYDDYYIYFIPTHWGNTPWTGLDLDSNFGKEVKKRIVSKIEFKPDIYIQHTIPSEFKPLGEYNIGITAGIETNLAPPNWIDGVNRMDMVIGSSNHSIKILKQSSYKQTDKQTGELLKILQVKPELELKVLHEGVDIDEYKSVKTPLKNIDEYLKEIPETFCYLFVGHWLQGKPFQDRKDVVGLIRVFTDTFKKTPKDKQPALILKTSSGPYSEMDKEKVEKKIRDALGNDIETAPPIYLLYGDLTNKEMISLYKHAKIRAMVSFTKGEGFGRPLAEFALTGKPVVTTSWSGHVDFLHPDCSILLPGELVDTDPSVHNDWFIKGSKWFRPNYTVASQTIRDIKNNYKAYIDRSKPQRNIIKKEFSLDSMKDNFKAILEECDNVKEKIEINLPELPDFK